MTSSNVDFDEPMIVPASSICESIFDGTHDSPKQQDYGFKLVTSRHIKANKVLSEEAYFINEEDYTKINKRSRLQIGDVLFTMIGTVGEVCRLSVEPDFAIKNIGVFRPAEASDSLWIYYYLLSPEGRKNIDAAKRGTTQQFMGLKELREFPVNFPKDSLYRHNQMQILELIDAKIDANYALSKTLEDIAQTIFKSWFIDFDPVKAKMAGEKPAGMDAATAALFPDTMKESELGLIPTGWQVKLLGDLVVPRKGKTITKATCVVGEVPVVAGGLQPAYFHNTANVVQPAITISASGANAGYVRLYLTDIWASDCSYINSEITETVHFWYLFLSRNQELIYGMQQGAAQPHIYPSDLMRLKLSHPNSIDSVMKFEEVVRPLFLEIGALERQNDSLRSLRDSLLPRLISGELQIPEEMLAS